MSHENLTYDDLLRIVELVKASEQFSEFRLKVGEVEVELRRRSANGAPVAIAPSTSPISPADTSTLVLPGPTASSPHAPAPPCDPASWPEGSTVIRSPTVGTFYRAPAPGAPPFVDVGRTVEPDTTVCIIEVMKLMNSISAGTRGTVMHILAEDAAPVEAGQPLIVLNPPVAKAADAGTCTRVSSKTS